MHVQSLAPFIVHAPTCDLHLKLNILKPLNIIFLSNGFKNESFALHPFPSKFQDFEIFVCFGFSSSLSNEHVLSSKRACFCYTNSLKSIV
jgi:hypothetical protein